ncbi:MAG TPA: TraB/GumN family protein, partial [Terriglobia bacterium]|nr:TraB/GumN family protein [Terriglobia bacterium]
MLMTSNRKFSKQPIALVGLVYLASQILGVTSAGEALNKETGTQIPHGGISDNVGQMIQRKPDSAAQGFLWRVKSTTSEVYLLGVSHWGNERFYPLSPSIETAFESSDTLVLETALDTDSQKHLQERLFAAGTYPAGETLEQHLSAGVRDLYGEYLRDRHLATEHLNRFRPWVAAWVISREEDRRLGLSYEQSVPMHFLKRAQGHKTVVGLETADDYVSLLGGWKERTQELFLKLTLLEIKDSPPALGRLIDAWRSGDSTAAESLTTKEMSKSEFQPVYKSLVIDRNARMAGRVEQYLQANGTYFVVLGAGHLLGKDSIISLLGQKGYR